MVVRFYKKYIAIFLCIGIICCSLIAAKQKADIPQYRLPILMYHHISTTPASWGAYVISPKHFRQDMQYLYENGYQTVTTKQLIALEQYGTPIPQKSVMITFDDGYESFYAYAFDILKEFGFTAVLSVVGIETDRYSQSSDHNIQYSNCTWDQLKEMSESGIVEMGNHTYNLHKFGQRKGCMIQPGEDQMQYRQMLAEDVGALQDRLQANGIDCNVFVYPFGEICDSAEDVIDSLGFSISFGHGEKSNVLYGTGLQELKGLYRFNRHSDLSTEQWMKTVL